MKHKSIKNVILVILTSISLIARGCFNLYISKYYQDLNFRNLYNIKPHILFFIICIIIIIQFTCAYKFYKNK